MAAPKVIRIYGHPRSGNHLTMHTLKLNFYPDVDLTAPGGAAGHWADRQRTDVNPVGKLFGGHGPWNRRVGRCIYVYRDGRDVAVALFLAKATMHPDWRDLSFSEYLRKPLDWLWSPGHRAKRKRPQQTIAKHWRRHLENWANHKRAFYLRYEDLVSDPLQALMQTRKFFGFPLEGDYRSVQEWVGHWPDGKPPGAWAEYFSYKDLDFFFQHVPKDFWGLS